MWLLDKRAVALHAVVVAVALSFDSGFLNGLLELPLDLNEREAGDGDVRFLPVQGVVDGRENGLCRLAPGLFKRPSVDRKRYFPAVAALGVPSDCGVLA